MQGTESERTAYPVHLCHQMTDRAGVLERRLVLDEATVANETTTDRVRGSSRGHFDVDKLLNDGNNGFDVLLIVVSLGRLALGNSNTLDEVHGDIPIFPRPSSRMRGALPYFAQSRRPGCRRRSIPTRFSAQMGDHVVAGPLNARPGLTFRS